MTELQDDGHAIAFGVLRRGTRVRSSDGVQLGTVKKVQVHDKLNTLDGLVVETPDGKRFLDAPEVARIAERAVTTTFPAVEAAQHFEEAPNPVLQRLGMSTTVRRSKRAANRVRDRFGR